MDNPFKKFFSGIGDAFSSSKVSQSVIGLDIGSSSVKVVQLKKKGGKAILETYGTLALGPYTNDSVGAVTNLNLEQTCQAVVDILRESGVTVRDGGVAIPSSSSLLFTIELPSQIDEKDLAAIVPTEARKYIPVPISEVLLDYWVIPKKQESFYDKEDDKAMTAEKTEVLAVAIHNDTVERYKSVMQKTGIINPVFELETFSAIRSSFRHEMATVLLLDFGAAKTKLSIIEYGIVRSFHVINRGSFDITKAISQSLSVNFKEAEEMKRTYGLLPNVSERDIKEIAILSVNYIIAETNNTILNYEKQYNKTISKVILSGAGSLLKGFKEVAEGQFSCPVEISDPFDKVEAPAFLGDILKGIGPEFAVSVGLALRKLQ